MSPCPPPPTVCVPKRKRQNRLCLPLSTTLALLLLFVSPSFPTSAAGTSNDADDNTHIAQSLFRFPASRLGPHFDSLLRTWYEDWLNLPDGASSFQHEESGREFAAEAVSAPSTTAFRRQCYENPDDGSGGRNLATLYTHLEYQRKSTEHKLYPVHEELQKTHKIVDLLYPEFMVVGGDANDDEMKALRRARIKARHSRIGRRHGKDKKNDASPIDMEFATDDDRWTWRPGGQFSSRGAEGRLEFRGAFQRSMKEAFDAMGIELEQGRQSGMYWYPPGGVREWHRNNHDVTGHPVVEKQLWRMYYVRVAPDDDASGTKGNDMISANDRSALHLIPGGDAGVTSEALKNAGARRLNEEERQRRWDDGFAKAYNSTEHSEGACDAEGDDFGESFDRNAVWRIPDQNGYLSFFRLPDIWHCVVAEEGVHRYSLGFAFSDSEIRSLLSFAGVPFDVMT